ncbi:MAG TPA: hypothetical protein HPP87_10515 [Planctomycetes bacterium]|nr:hypothetical protein [Planctomycetota bacterium]
MKLLFKYATRGRPDWFKDTLNTYYRMLSGKYEYQFVISMDQDDETMNNVEIRQFLDAKENLVYFYGHNHNKIEAINADMGNRQFDILIVIADDMRPVMQDYDDIIVQDILTYFPELDGCLHYDDDAHAGQKLIVLSIMGKKLYDRFGYIYHPEYRSMWCDNEFTDIVRAWGKVQWIPKVVIKHEFLKYGNDATYAKNNQSWNTDKALYLSRKERGFNVLQSAG